MLLIDITILYVFYNSSFSSFRPISPNITCHTHENVSGLLIFALFAVVSVGRIRNGLLFRFSLSVSIIGTVLAIACFISNKKN